jgi:hypothetical protein
MTKKVKLRNCFVRSFKSAQKSECKLIGDDENVLFFEERECASSGQFESRRRWISALLRVDHKMVSLAGLAVAKSWGFRSREAERY